MRKTIFFTTVVTALAALPHIAQAADTQNGAKLYATYCASCHGPNGKGVGAGTTDFSRSNALLQTDAALLSSIKAGRRGMPGFLGVLRERELLDVVAYLRTFF